MSVTTSSSKTLFWIRWAASPDNTPCVIYARTLTAPASIIACAALHSVPPESTMSSTRIACLSFTSPIKFINSALPASGRILSTIAISPLNMSANFLARTAPPASGDTNTVPISCIPSGISSASGASGVRPSLRLISFANITRLVKSSTGMSKKPWICPACRSIVSTLSAPAVVNKLATSFAVIGVRLALFRSCRAYPKYGMTAVILLALDLRAASIIIINSIKLSLTGVDVL